MSAAKQRGTSWESEIVKFLQASGVPHAERRALAGSKDRGDIAGLPGVVIEAKSAARVTLSDWWKEAEEEKANDNAHVGVVWFKRRGKTSAAHGYVLMDGQTLVQLLREAGYISPSPTRE